MNIRHLEIIKDKEVFWYEDMPGWKIVIGVRGVGEFKIDKWDVVRAEDSFRQSNGRNWTSEEALKWAIKWADKEKDYIDFEEVKPNILLLGLENSGPETNETK